MQSGSMLQTEYRGRASLLLFNIHCLVIAVLTMAVLWPGVYGDFFFDDLPNITQNSGLYMFGLDHHSIQRVATSFPGDPGLRPLSMLSFGLNFFVQEEFDPFAFKLSNLLIHFVTVFALAGLLRQLFGAMAMPVRRAAAMSLVISCIWAIHPLQVSSVLYVVQRMQILSTLFTVLALWSYLDFRQTQIIGGVAWRKGGRTFLLCLLGCACKEDAVLLPAFALGLEIAVLHFRAASGVVERCWQSGYAFLCISGAVLFVIWIVPHYWSWEAYPGRNFSTYERLLTQGRVLVMYLGQMIWPLPSRLPFYYDDFTVSHGWLQPVTTLWCWLLLVVVAALAFYWRHRRPIMMLGVWVFLVGHFVTSNVIGLELAFEHRNHLPLVGVVMIVVDGFFWLWGKRHCRAIAAAILVLMMIGLAHATYQRAQYWGDPLLLAEKHAEFAPRSARAWVGLCRAHYDLSQAIVSHASFQRAIDACSYAAHNLGSAVAQANVVVLKSIRGDVVEADWALLAARLQVLPMSVENTGIAINLVRNVQRGIGLDVRKVLNIVRLVRQRANLSEVEYVQMGVFVLQHSPDPIEALAYFIQANRLMKADDPLKKEVLDFLEAQGLDEWSLILKGAV